MNDVKMSIASGIVVIVGVVLEWYIFGVSKMILSLAGLALIICGVLGLLMNGILSIFLDRIVTLSNRMEKIERKILSLEVDEISNTISKTYVKTNEMLNAVVYSIVDDQIKRMNGMIVEMTASSLIKCLPYGHLIDSMTKDEKAVFLDAMRSGDWRKANTKFKNRVHTIVIDD